MGNVKRDKETIKSNGGGDKRPTAVKKALAVKKAPSAEPAEPEIALTAVAPIRNQKEASNFLDFLQDALERNSDWLNSMVEKQNDIKCALMVGSGPNRFQLQEILYPSDKSETKLEIELKNSEDHAKIAIAALLRLTHYEIDQLLKYVKTHMNDNMCLREDMIKGKALGVSFAVLRPFSDKQYRVMERIIVGNSMEGVVPNRKRKTNEMFESHLKKPRKDQKAS